ncbi:cgi-94 protein [Stachybotrys elegans]|uniref:U3 small nucleolar RNA-associated protein 11 n=1 Tax=Stachybotrys elegans TaxID=80388 RepID=A0A8K0WQZ2_9HYPO|nr:cgi-94 protein [Stachybotrys elegans]
MSSMRNAIQRRPHRERAQPLERKRLGLLEKHKDYSLRAKDFNKKKATLKSLREKAADRNEDEFYFGMMSRQGPGSKIQDGKSWSGTVQGDRGNKSLSVEAVRLMKTQDMGYVRTMKQIVSKEVARLEERVVMARGLNHLDDVEEDDGDDDFYDDDDEDDDEKPAAKRSKPSAPRKIVFMDEEAERDEAMQEIEQQEEDNDDAGTGAEIPHEEARRIKSLARARRELEHARKKLKALTDAERELDAQRTKMAKTATSGGYTRRGKKIMVRARKR